MPLSSLIPSMFQRRLLLLALLFAAWLAVLGGQLSRLTVAQGEALHRQAESRLVREQWIPTLRGRILDRKGRVLAHDRPRFDAAIDYRVISGEWAQAQARAYARARWRAEWPDLRDDRREELTDLCRGAFEAHLERGWEEFARASGLTRDEVEAAKAGVMSRVARLEADVFERRERAEIAAAARRGTRLSPAVLASIRRRVRSQPLREHVTGHVLASAADDAIGFALLRLEAVQVPLHGVPGFEPLAGDLFPLVPGLAVRDGGGRAHPFESVEVEVDLATLPEPLREQGMRPLTVRGPAGAVVGSLRDQPHPEDIQRRRAKFGEGDLGRYREDDRVGSTGVEGALEDTLRGLRGVRSISLDTGEVRLTESRPGADVALTIDIMLQARVQAAMDPALGLARVQPWHRAAGVQPEDGEMPDGTALSGAAVVIDIASGDVLALVSTPTPEDAASGEGWSEIDRPHLNRAIAGVYAPGSVAKALVLAAAVTRGNFRLGERIDCTGHLLPDRPDIYRCWTYRERYGYTTHNARLGHAPDEVDAIMASCNIFFFTLGGRLGPQGVRWMYESNGVGRSPRLGIGHEEPGLLGTAGDPSNISAWDATQMGIGQGPVAWTPLHAANAYATLARGGVAIPPRVIAGGGLPEAESLGLDSRAVAAALRGLRLAVNDPRGTGHHLGLPDGRTEPFFDVPGVALWGKTGTAQSSPLVGDPDGDGPLPRQVLRRGDHSWFVVLVGDEGGGPRYAVAVMMEYAGSGGKVSGPIVKQVLLALRGEGYLRP